MNRVTSLGDMPSPVNHFTRSRKVQKPKPNPLKMTNLQTTVLAAIRMGGVHQVHLYREYERPSGNTSFARIDTIFRLGSPFDGQDVTTQVKSLGRRGLLKDVTYPTYDQRIDTRYE